MRELGTPDERVEAVTGRLRGVPGLLEEAGANLEPGLPAASVAGGIEYAEGLTDLFGPTVREFAAAAGHEGALDEASREACAALERFTRYMRDELAPGASAECGAGSAVVADVLRWEHVLDEPPEALVDYGRRTLAETRARMEEVAAELGHASAAEAIAEIQRRTPRLDELVGAYRRAVEEARAYVVEHDIASLPAGEELIVMATPTFLRTLLPFAAYEAPGPYEARQLGMYYVTPPPDGLGEAELAAAMRSHPWASFGTTGVHEAYPGHHLQLVAANQAPTLARRIAAIPDGGSLFVEGWAFYCEELMEREGFLADPAAHLMRLNDQVWRACRVIIDLELHLGHMDLPEAVDFLATRSAHEPPRGRAGVPAIRRGAGTGDELPARQARGDWARRGLPRAARREPQAVPRRASLVGIAAAGGHRLGDGHRPAPRGGYPQFLTLSRCSAPWSTTWSRPAAFARYRALSASSMSSSRTVASRGHVATPTLMVMFTSAGRPSPV